MRPTVPTMPWPGPHVAPVRDPAPADRGESHTLTPGKARPCETEATPGTRGCESSGSDVPDAHRGHWCPGAQGQLQAGPAPRARGVWEAAASLLAQPAAGRADEQHPRPPTASPPPTLRADPRAAAFHFGRRKDARGGDTGQDVAGQQTQLVPAPAAGRGLLAASAVTGPRGTRAPGQPRHPLAAGAGHRHGSALQPSGLRCGRGLLSLTRPRAPAAVPLGATGGWQALVLGKPAVGSGPAAQLHLPRSRPGFHAPAVACQELSHGPKVRPETGREGGGLTAGWRLL